MEYNYLLSICMMVKDEEKNIRRCLDAMRYLIDKNDVELIIVDTGSKDRTADIAREFTDKVYFHPWENNFSEMRNITISYAKGEYILIMDADEVLTDPVLLYECISDERLKEYNTFLFKIKNLESSGDYTVLAQERVFKNDGSFRYGGAVHNQPVYKSPILDTGIYVEHYGYLFHDKELREKKFQRTAGILKKELEKNPDSLYYRFQLARSYSAHRDKKEAYEEIQKVYKLITVSKEMQRLHLYVYGTHALICANIKEYDEVIRVCLEGLEICPEYLDLYYLLAFAYANTGREEEACSAYKKYIELSKQYDKLKISTDRSIEMYYLGRKSQDTAYAYIADNLYKKGKYNECYEYVSQILDWDIKSRKLAMVLMKLKKYDELKSLYIANNNNKGIRDSIETLIEEEALLLNDDTRKSLQLTFSDGDEQYFILNRIRSCEGTEKQQLVSEALKKLDFSDLPDYYADILSDIDKDARPVLSFLKKLRKGKIKELVKRMIESKKGLDDFFEHYLLNENIRHDDHSSLKVYISIAYVFLLLKAIETSKAGTEPFDTHNAIFEKYVEYGFDYIMTIYKHERLRIYYSMLEDIEDTFFIALHYAKEACEKGEYKVGVKYFREAVKANAYLICYMNSYRGKLFTDPKYAYEEVESHE